MSKKLLLTDSIIDLLQYYSNLDATMVEYNKRYIEPDIGELIDLQNEYASSIVTYLINKLKIKGVPNLKTVEEDREFYERFNRIKE